jgi:drug/metabolite transporter (DMT)-like permease
LYTQYGILPFISLLVAIISGSYAWFIVKKLINKNYSLFIINGYSMIIGGIGCLITFILFDQTTVYNNNYYLFLKWTSILVIISNIIAYNIYGYLLKYYSLTLISFVGFTCPLWSAIYEYIFYKRSFEINYWISFCIITVAILLFYSDEIHNNNRNNQDELYE